VVGKLCPNSIALGKPKCAPKPPERSKIMRTTRGPSPNCARCGS
jgi:hypothetical protein